MVCWLVAACGSYDDVEVVQHGWLPFPTGAEYVAFVDNGEELLHQGDIVFSRDALLDESQMFVAANYTKTYKWSLGVLPYEIETDADDAFRHCIETAVKDWNRLDVGTVLHPRPASQGVDYLLFKPIASGPSSAPLGRVFAGGKQTIKISDCSSVFHEVGHTIGLIHEQSRPDRDEHVTIHWDNIEPGRESEFERYFFAKKLGVYDHTSVMHYVRNAYAVDPERATISAGAVTVLGNKKLSDLDKAGIAALYPIEKPVLDCSASDRTTGCRAAVSGLKSEYYTWAGGSYWTCGEIFADGSPPDAGLWGQEMLGCDAQVAQCERRTSLRCDPQPPEPVEPEPPQERTPTEPWPPYGNPGPQVQPTWPPYGTPGPSQWPAYPPEESGCNAGSSAGGLLLLVLFLAIRARCDRTGSVRGRRRSAFG